MSLKRLLRRYRLLIYPSFQLKLIAINAGVGLGIYLVMAYRLSMSFENLRQESLGAGIAANDYFYVFLNEQSRLLYLFLFVSLAVAVTVGCITTLVLSHRLAGPMIRLRNFLKRVGENGQGETIRPLRFRKDDFFREIPPLVNRAVRFLQRGNGKDGDGPRKAA